MGLGWRSAGTSLSIYITRECWVAFLGRPELLLLWVCSMSVTTSWVSNSKADQKQSLCSNNNYPVLWLWGVQSLSALLLWQGPAQAGAWGTFSCSIPASLLGFTGPALGQVNITHFWSPSIPKPSSDLALKWGSFTWAAMERSWNKLWDMCEHFHLPHIPVLVMWMVPEFLPSSCAQCHRGGHCHKVVSVECSRVKTAKTEYQGIHFLDSHFAILFFLSNKIKFYKNEIKFHEKSLFHENYSSQSSLLYYIHIGKECKILLKRTSWGSSSVSKELCKCLVKIHILGEKFIIPWNFEEGNEF